MAQVHFVFHQGLAVVRREEHQAVVERLEFRPRVQQPPDLVVYEGDLGVVGVDEVGQGPTGISSLTYAASPPDAVRSRRTQNLRIEGAG